MIEKINDEESKKIAEVRKTISGLQNFDDGFILRWLRASNRDVKQTEIALKRHLIYRKAWGLDDLVDKWKAPKVCKRCYSYGYPCSDKEGSPVLLSPFGYLDVEGLIKSCSSVDYIKTSLQHVEEGLRKAKESAAKTGVPYEQMLMIIDLNNLSSSHYSFKPFTYSYLTLLTIFQENYPLVFKKIIVIRAPSIAQYAYSLLQPVLSENMQNLVEMLSDDWSEKLFELIDADQWPEYWGGKMKDSNGDGKCPSKVRLQEDPVPDSYYITDNMEDAEAVTVYAGDKHVVAFDVQAPNSQIYWKFRTKGEDIGFSIYYDSTGEKSDVGSMEQIFPHIRLECSIVPVQGTIICEKKGKYVVEFDNYYSWFSAKEMLISLKVIS